MVVDNIIKTYTEKEEINKIIERLRDIRFEDPFAEEKRREQEWDYFLIPYSLREKLRRADLIQCSREYHEWAVSYLQQLNDFQ